MPTSYTGTAAANTISFSNLQQPGTTNNFTVDGGAGTDSFYFANGKTSYLSDYPIGNFTVGTVDASGFITVTGSSIGNGCYFSIKFKGVETLYLSGGTIALTYAPPPDTTPPIFASAAVNGLSLVMTYTEATTLEAANIPAASAFAVNGASSGSHTVSSVVVNAAAKTVTLTLAAPVTNGESVTVAYTDPTAGNDAKAIQDAAGNDAATLAATTVTNNTPVPADTTPPIFASAAVNGSSLVMTYTEATTLEAANITAASAFAVNGASSGSHTVSSVVVNAAAKTVTLTLAAPVTNGESVTVAYTDPTAGNDAKAIQDAAGNDAATLAATTVTNNTPVPADTTPPIFASAAVNGSSLVMTYTEATTLEAANITAASAFAVNGASSGSHTVSSVVVNAAAKTVTLTLAAPVTNGESVTVAYTDPTAGNDAKAIQDAAGNDAATLAATTVTNNTPVPTNHAPTGSVTITGTTTQGQILTVNTSALVDVDGIPTSVAGALSYQWYATGTAISGATGTTYTLTQAQVGKAMTVKASYTDLKGAAESMTSAATATVANVNDAPTGSVSIAGTPSAGQILTASNNLADVDGLGSISYQPYFPSDI